MDPRQVSREEKLGIDPLLSSIFFDIAIPNTSDVEFDPSDIPLPDKDPEKLTEFLTSKEGKEHKAKLKKLMDTLLAEANAQGITLAAEAHKDFADRFLSYDGLNSPEMNRINHTLFYNGVPALISIAKYIAKYKDQPGKWKDGLTNLWPGIYGICAPGATTNIINIQRELLGKENFPRFLKELREKMAEQVAAGIVNEYIYDMCELMEMRRAPTIPDIFSKMKKNAAYVYVKNYLGNDKIYYVNREKKECNELQITSDQRNLFVQKVYSAHLPRHQGESEDNPILLSTSELQFIGKYIGHAHTFSKERNKVSPELKNIDIYEGMETHYIKGITNNFADTLSLDVVSDNYIRYTNQFLLSEFWDLFEANIKNAISIDQVIDLILEKSELFSKLERFITADRKDYEQLTEIFNNEMKFFGSGDNLELNDLLTQDENTRKYIAIRSEARHVIKLNVLQRLKNEGFIKNEDLQGNNVYRSTEINRLGKISYIPKKGLDLAYVDNSYNLIVMPKFNPNNLSALKSTSRINYVVATDKIYYVDLVTNSCRQIAGVNEAEINEFSRRGLPRRESSRSTIQQAKYNRIATSLRSKQQREFTEKLKLLYLGVTGEVLEIPAQNKEGQVAEGKQEVAEDQEEARRLHEEMVEKLKRMELSEFNAFVEHKFGKKLPENPSDVDQIEILINDKEINTRIKLNLNLHMLQTASQPLPLVLSKLYFTNPAMFKVITASLKSGEEEIKVMRRDALRFLTTCTFTELEAYLKDFKKDSLKYLGSDNDLYAFCKSVLNHKTEQFVRVFATPKESLEFIQMYLASAKGVNAKISEDEIFKLWNNYFASLANENKAFDQSMLKNLAALFLQYKGQYEVDIISLSGADHAMSEEGALEARIANYLFMSQNLDILHRIFLTEIDLATLESVFKVKLATLSPRISKSIVTCNLLAHLKKENRTADYIISFLNDAKEEEGGKKIALDAGTKGRIARIIGTSDLTEFEDLRDNLGQSINDENLEDFIKYLKDHAKDVDVAIRILGSDKLDGLVKNQGDLIQIINAMKGAKDDPNREENLKFANDALFAILDSLGSEQLNGNILAEKNALLNLFALVDAPNRYRLIYADSIAPAIATMDADTLIKILSELKEDKHRIRLLEKSNVDVNKLNVTQFKAFITTFNSYQMQFVSDYMAAKKSEELASLKEKQKPKQPGSGKEELVEIDAMKELRVIDENALKLQASILRSLIEMKKPPQLVSDISELDKVMRLFPNASMKELLGIMNIDAQKLSRIIPDKLNQQMNKLRWLADFPDTLPNRKMVNFLIYSMVVDYIHRKEAKESLLSLPSTSLKLAKKFRDALLENKSLDNIRKDLEVRKSEIGDIYRLHKFIHSNPNMCTMENVHQRFDNDVNLSIYPFLILGEKQTGKTELIKTQLSNPDGVMAYYVIKSGENYEKTEACKVQLREQDTATHEAINYRAAKAAIIVFDVTNQASFNMVRTQANHARMFGSKNISLILVGTKTDDVSKPRVVSDEEAAKLAAELNMPYFPVSAAKKENVNEPFYFALKSTRPLLTSDLMNDKVIKESVDRLAAKPQSARSEQRRLSL